MARIKQNKKVQPIKNLKKKLQTKRQSPKAVLSKTEKFHENLNLTSRFSLPLGVIEKFATRKSTSSSNTTSIPTLRGKQTKKQTHIETLKKQRRSLPSNLPKSSVTTRASLARKLQDDENKKQTPSKPISVESGEIFTARKSCGNTRMQQIQSSATHAFTGRSFAGNPNLRPKPSKEFEVRKSVGGKNDGKSKTIPRKKFLRVSTSFRRKKPGVLALKEILHFQKTTDYLIPKQPVQRVICEILNECSNINLRIQSPAIEALREALEIYLVEFFEVCNLCAIHDNRKTVFPKDINLVKSLRS